MRANQLFPIATAAAMLVMGGCGPSRQAAESAASTAPQAHVRAPADPDLGTVTERFYQYVGGGHWKFAYAMLSPRYRATLTEAELMRRYENLANADVALRHTPGTVVIARLDAVDHIDRSRRVRVEEKVRLVWDGEQWTIDDIARRSLSPGTR